MVVGRLLIDKKNYLSVLLISRSCLTAMISTMFRSGKSYWLLNKVRITISLCLSQENHIATTIYISMKQADIRENCLLGKHPQLLNHSGPCDFSSTHLQLPRLVDHLNPLFQCKAFF